MSLDDLVKKLGLPSDREGLQNLISQKKENIERLEYDLKDSSKSKEMKDFIESLIAENRAEISWANLRLSRIRFMERLEK